MSESKATFNCVRCGFETDDKTHGCPACGCGLLLPHEKWRRSHLSDLPDMPDGVARRLRGKDGTSPELTMVEKAREHISRTPRPSQELENLEQDIDAEVQQALSADIPLPPVEYLIAEERSLKTDEPEVSEDNADTDIEALMEDQAEPEVAKSEKEDESVTPDVSEEVNTDNANANEEEIVLDENEIVLSGAAYVNNEEGAQSIPQRHSDPMMMELHDTFFKDETVETDPEISLDSIREAIRSSEASQEAMALEDELPDDALQPLEQSELEAVSQSGASKNTLEEEQFEELGDEAEIEPLPAEDTLAASRVVIDSEPGLGLDEALAKEELEQRKSAQESFSTQREIQTTGFVSSEIEPVQKPIFFDDDGQEIPFIQPDNVEAPALWREPSSKQIFSAGLIDTLLVLICVAPVTIIATVSKQTQILEPGLMSAIPWHVIWAFWGSAFVFHGLLTFASIYWTGATAGGNLLRISVLRVSDATKPDPKQTGLLALASGLGVVSLMVGPFFALWLNRRFRGPGHFIAGTVPVIPNAQEV